LSPAPTFIAARRSHDDDPLDLRFLQRLPTTFTSTTTSFLNSWQALRTIQRTNKEVVVMPRGTAQRTRPAARARSTPRGPQQRVVYAPAPEGDQEARRDRNQPKLTQHKRHEKGSECVFWHRPHPNTCDKGDKCPFRHRGTAASPWDPAIYGPAPNWAAKGLQFVVTDAASGKDVVTTSARASL
jgi:hypothetical protein